MTYDPERSACEAAEHIYFDWQFIFFPTFLSGCAIKNKKLFKTNYEYRTSLPSFWMWCYQHTSLGFPNYLWFMPGGTLPVMEHLGLTINTGRPGTNLLQLAANSEIVSLGFLVVYIYRMMMLCVLGKLFMAKCLGNECPAVIPKSVCKDNNKWVGLQMYSVASLSEGAIECSVL